MPIVHFPVTAVPDNPFFPGGVLPNIPAMLLQKPLGIGSVGKLYLAFFQLLKMQKNTFIPYRLCHHIPRLSALRRTSCT
jgi:hypothetical protein